MWVQGKSTSTNCLYSWLTQMYKPSSFVEKNQQRKTFYLLSQYFIPRNAIDKWNKLRYFRKDCYSYHSAWISFMGKSRFWLSAEMDCSWTQRFSRVAETLQLQPELTGDIITNPRHFQPKQDLKWQTWNELKFQRLICDAKIIHNGKPAAHIPYSASLKRSFFEHFRCLFATISTEVWFCGSAHLTV